MSLARLSFVQLFRQSDFSSAKLVPVKGHMIRSNRVIMSIRKMTSFPSLKPAITGNPLQLVHNYIGVIQICNISLP